MSESQWRNGSGFYGTMYNYIIAESEDFDNPEYKQECDHNFTKALWDFAVQHAVKSMHITEEQACMFMDSMHGRDIAINISPYISYPKCHVNGFLFESSKHLLDIDKQLIISYPYWEERCSDFMRCILFEEDYEKWKNDHIVKSYDWIDETNISFEEMVKTMESLLSDMYSKDEIFTVLKDEKSKPAIRAFALLLSDIPEEMRVSYYEEDEESFSPSC